MFKVGDKVKIVEEWKNSPNDNFTYRVVEPEEHTDRVSIMAIDSNLTFPPLETVRTCMITKA